jgi:hypothetical protein
VIVSIPLVSASQEVRSWASELVASVNAATNFSERAKRFERIPISFRTPTRGNLSELAGLVNANFVSWA